MAKWLGWASQGHKMYCCDLDFPVCRAWGAYSTSLQVVLSLMILDYHRTHTFYFKYKKLRWPITAIPCHSLQNQARSRHFVKLRPLLNTSG